MNGAIAQDNGETRSSFNSVGAIGGGKATTPLANANCVASIDFATSGASATGWPSSGRPSFSAAANAVDAAMPKMIDPRTRRACSAAVTSRPRKNTIRSGEANCGLSFQPPSSLFPRSKWAVLMPMTTMNSPMPTAMPLRMLGLIASISFSRTPSVESSRKTTPE